MEVEADLKARWVPSTAALAAAEAVYTGHFLVGKEYGWWTVDVEVVHADEPVARVGDGDEGGFKARSLAILDGALLDGERTGTVGYTRHWRSGDWAVFEDILDVPTILKHARKEGTL